MHPTPNWPTIFEARWDGPAVYEADEIKWGAFMQVEDVDEMMSQWNVVPMGTRCTGAGAPNSRER
jgi:hypothetical protein